MAAGLAGVILRVLDAGNADRLLGAAVFDEPVDDAQLQAFAEDPNSLLVFAEEAEAVVGFASGTVLLHPDKPPILFVNEVGTLPAHRRRGIGAQLVRRLLAEARFRGVTQAWLATEEHNEAARGLYRAIGARETGGLVMYDWGLEHP
ncbi:GNAT family N-acetyltransferase [Jannaschia sp. W003]|uniref:GNAT family N-acetyltransferase n=1 Tax=Jannaschia sp. W003 TaxID=2867012 RepID=UPI0021A27220|nr:GNAT family N-acetyltransferase [Jannaschia sp. W003]UWQ20402.1 GNAT family N-acetyltransferase [Jannaschia sp. W003]